MIEAAIFLDKDNKSYILRWANHISYFSVENEEGETLCLCKDTAFDLINTWFRSHFEKE